jgi:lipoprotein signal peptidase
VATAKSSQIRSRLESEKKRIEDELAQLASSRSTDDRREGSPFGKREEEATESMELEKRLALESRLNSLLAEVQRALHKLDAGTYGYCDMCNTAIDPARMEALPQAILCLSCRQKVKNAKMNLQQVKWNIILFAIASLVIAADQLSKGWIQSNLYPGQSMPETGFFRLTHAENTGAAFSVFYGNNDILIVVAIIGIILLLTYVFVVYRRFPYLDTRINKIALGIILGGTIGNLIDRIWLRHVRDFIDVGPWPIFNVADSSVVVGVIIFAFSLLLASRDSGSPQQR